MNQSEQLMVSTLHQYEYCPRRCYLIHVESEFVENLHTSRGTREHERVDQIGHRIDDHVRVEYALPIWSDSLGLTGRCDVVEFHEDGTIYPVEYKHGKRKQWENDDIQLTAQALCLEEMFQRSIERGAIFHQQSKRRREVVFTENLKQQVQNLIPLIRDLLQQETRPAPTTHSQRCRGCSMIEVCQPELWDQQKRFQKMYHGLFQVVEEE